MFNQKIFFLLAFLLLLLGTSQMSYAQLLEDRGKLKTAKVKRPGFKSSSRSVKQPKSSGKRNVQKPFTPKYTQENAGAYKTRKTNPKYSQPSKSKSRYAATPRYTKKNAGQFGHKMRASPRYTQENAGQFGHKKRASPRYTKENAGQFGHKMTINPRYTQENAGQFGHKMKINPRYTQENAGQFGHKMKINPRYTQENAGQFGHKMKINPRYTQENAGQFGHKMKINPRYTQENAGQFGHKMTINPRYTQENAGQFGHKMKINPRYTQENAGQFGHKMTVNPRYTQENAGQSGHKMTVKPRYSTPPNYVAYPASKQRSGFLPTINLLPGKSKSNHKQGKESSAIGPKIKQENSPPNTVAQHNKTVKSYKKHSTASVFRFNIPNSDVAKFHGSTKRQKKGKDMHPSANYLWAKNSTSQTVRNTKRKANIAWVRVNGNQVQPDAVKKKVGKAKFDKEEKDIWNN
ncbi:MAG: hypothetical protein OCD76_18560 [Reichenbachiella sp.]